MPDKILVTNCAALQKKYGKSGLGAVLGAVKVLVAADRKRGLKSQLIDISDPAGMKKFKAKAVTSAKSERQCKDAVDAIYATAKPDYLVLLDGPDVIPHLVLDNPAAGDGDQNVPSDLPYASDAPFTRRDAAAFAAVTRVVGRITGIAGSPTPKFLIKQLNAAARFRTLKRSDYLAHLALSAEVWAKSTEESVNNIFGTPAVKTCPPTKSPGVVKALEPLSHFINCHGAQVDPKFYGQHGSQFPVAMTSDDVAKGARRNALVAAECCYGAQIFDPGMAGGKLPISNAYLDIGAVGFFGSTTIAYGPSEGNGAADLITQYFLIDALAGASLGRSCLQARQRFVLSQKMEDPVNLKTLAQFILLADPSLQPCPLEGHDAGSGAKMIDYGAARETRRIFLVAAGKAAAGSSGFPGKKVIRSPRLLHELVLKLARQQGFRARAGDLAAFHVVGGDNYGVEMKARAVEQKVLILVEHEKKRGRAARKVPKDLPRTSVFVAHAQDNRVVEVAAYVRR
jgi:hypothetical protein